MSASEKGSGSDNSPSVRDSWEATENGLGSEEERKRSRSHSSEGSNDDKFTELPQPMTPQDKLSGSNDLGGSMDKSNPGSHDSRGTGASSDRFSAISSLDNLEVREEDNVAAETLQQLIGQIEEELPQILNGLKTYKAQYRFLMTVVSYLEGMGIPIDSQFREDMEALRVDDAENNDGYSGKETGPYNNIAGDVMALKAEIEGCVPRSDIGNRRKVLFVTPTPEHRHRVSPAPEEQPGQGTNPMVVLSGVSDSKQEPERSAQGDAANGHQPTTGERASEVETVDQSNQGESEPTTTPPSREAGYRSLLNTGDSRVNASEMQLNATDKPRMSASFGKRQVKSEGEPHDHKTPVTGYQISKEQSLRCQCLELRERVNSIRELQIQKDDSLRELTNKINKLMTKMPSYEQFGGYGLAALALSSVLTGVCARELIADKAWQDIQHLGRHWPQCMTLVCLMALTAMIAHFVYHTRLPVHIESNIPSEEAGLHQEGFWYNHSMG